MTRRVIGLLVTASLWAPAAWSAVPVVTNVTASQRGTNKLVDIYFEVYDADGDTLKTRVEVSDNGGATYDVPAFTFTGDYGDGVSTGANKHIVWDAGIDWNGEYSDQMRVKVYASDSKGLPGLAWGNEVPAGGFLMGQDNGPEGAGPSRHVNIPWSYWLSKYEITAGQYADYLNTALTAGEVVRISTTEVQANAGIYDGVPAGSKLIALGGNSDVGWSVSVFAALAGKSNFPVRVTWYGAAAFAQHYGYDLPTEAEWEKAARGAAYEDQGEHRVYPWGDNIAGGNANYWGNGGTYSVAISPVGFFDGDQLPLGPDMANAYNLYDIAGNLWEWTRSIKLTSVESYPQEESLSHSVNDLSGSGVRAVRGGSWRDSTSNLRCFVRSSASPNDDDYDLGFRVVRRTATP